MRRKDREVTDFSKMLEVISKTDVLRIAFDDGNGIYICPVNYGFKADGEKLSFYFHGTNAGGRKCDALTGNVKKVAFEIDADHEKVYATPACSSTWKYASVMGDADVVICDDDEKIVGLEKVMNNVFKKEGPFEFAPTVVKNTLVVRLDVTDWTCKIN